MKAVTVWVVAALVFAMSLQTSAQTKEQEQAFAKLNAASKVQAQAEINPHNGIPHFVTFQIAAQGNLSPDRAVFQFLEEHKDLFSMANPSGELSTKSTMTDGYGDTHVKMQQMFNGIPVFGHELIFHFDGERNIYAVNGDFMPGIALADTKPGISAESAIEVAKAKTRGTVYRWETELEEMLPQGETWRPEAELMIYQHNNESSLVYRTMIAVEEPQMANWVYFIDAKSGEVIDRYDDIKTADAIGTGNSLYRGQVGIGTNQKSRKSYELKDNPRNIWTYNANSRTTRLPGTLFTDSDNLWGTGNKSNAQTAAVDAHWGAAQTYDYYLTSHQRNSLDNAGMRIISSVHYGSNVVNAYWNGQQMLYGDGNGVQADPLVDLDVVAHELTHGVTQYSADLIYQYESGALNESMSDVFAMIIDTDDFTIGEDSWTPGISGDALRYMDNPNSGNQPKHMLHYVNTSSDNGGVHTNSGIPNFAAYLAVNGGTGQYGGTVSGIGRPSVANIWYRALTVYMTTSTNFAAARSATIQAATDLFGAGSLQVQAINDAWTAVGVNATARPLAGNPSDGAGNSFVGQSSLAPDAFALQQNYPNPFNPSTTIEYALPTDARVTLEVYDVLGRRVAELVSGHVRAGYHSAEFNASALASGIYFYRLNADDGSGKPFTQMRKLVLMK